MSDTIKLTDEMLDEITGGTADVIWKVDELAALKLAQSVEEIALIFDKKGLAFGADKAEKLIKGFAGKGSGNKEPVPDLQ